MSWSQEPKAKIRKQKKFRLKENETPPRSKEKQVLKGIPLASKEAPNEKT